MESRTKLFDEMKKNLSSRERDIVRLRFGLDDGRQRTYEEVAELFGIKAQDVETIEKNIIEQYPEMMMQAFKVGKSTKPAPRNIKIPDLDISFLKTVYNLSIFDIGVNYYNSTKRKEKIMNEYLIKYFTKENRLCGIRISAMSVNDAIAEVQSMPNFSQLQTWEKL